MLYSSFLSENSDFLFSQVESIESGLITVNGEKTCAEYKLKDNDYIRNKIHRSVHVCYLVVWMGVLKYSLC